MSDSEGEHTDDPVANLSALFPGLPRETVQSALDQNGGDVAIATDHLLAVQTMLEDRAHQHESNPHQDTVRTLQHQIARARKLRIGQEYDEAMAVVLQVIDDAESALGVDNICYIGAQQVLAEIYYDTGALDQAIEVAETARAGQIQIMGDEDADVHRMGGFLGEMYVEKGEYDKAKALLALAIADRADRMKAIGVSQNVASVRLLKSLATAHANTGDHLDAIDVLLELRPLVALLVGKVVNEYADVTGDLAGEYRLAGDAKKADKYAKKERKIRERVRKKTAGGTASPVKRLKSLFPSRRNSGASRQRRTEYAQVDDQDEDDDHAF